MSQLRLCAYITGTLVAARSTWAGFIFAVAMAASTSAMGQGLDFNRDIRPILSDRCYHCHGPDVENAESGLRLDQREDAIDYLLDGSVIERIDSDDPDLIMPPPNSKLSLTAAERQTLKKWIQQGAQYDQHWSFKLLPDKVEVPSVDDSSWPQGPIDALVLEKMRAHDLTPSRPASPLQWLRRVTLDLTGLPPSLAQVTAFEKAVAKNPESAYADSVDRLLASPAFGEHFAIAWLDAARYADSYGYQSDKLNTQWPYRDWVVQSLNQNLPYDQFLTWQLAGDLLDNPTRNQKLATAFNRIHRLNNEGGAVFEEWRIENVADRVHTFGTAVLGLTMECCRCHDHKYDPISMRDFYSMAAFFNSIDESGVYDRTEKVPCPSLLLPTASQSADLQRAALRSEQARLNYRTATESAASRYKAWKNSRPQTLEIPGLRFALALDREYDREKFKQNFYPTESDRTWTSYLTLVPVEDCDCPRIPTVQCVDGAADNLPPGPRRAIQLDGERGITTVGIEPFDRWTPFSVVITLQDVQRSPLRSVIAHHSRGTDCGYNGWDLTITDGRLESRLARVWPGNAISVKTVDQIPENQWHQVTATYDGSSAAAGLKIFLDGQPMKTETIRDDVQKSANVKVDHGGQFVIGQRFRARGFDGGLIDDVRVYQRSLTQAELVHLATGQAFEPSLDYFLSAIDQPSIDAMRNLTAARKALVMAEEVIDEIPVMRETEIPRETHVLARGAYDAPRDDSTQVNRNTITRFSLPFPKDAPRNRLGLAKWVTDPRHPLTARVAVNRLWAQFFTDPLVRTPENFGLQGELPTHPEMLDWLARDFIDHGWDVKRFCKQIVLSSTYRQDSSNAAGRLEQDPDNRWLARGPANRLSAEQIRDLALFASGLLVEQVGGPPVSPYQPGEDLWRESNSMSPPFKQSVGKSLYRRSLYSVWKRTAPLPNMMALDATTREVCTVKRSRTNTPLQALVLLNDPQFVETARVLADRVMTFGDDDETRIQLAFRSLTGRSADRQEIELLLKLLEQSRRQFGDHPGHAQKILSVGQTDASLQSADDSQIAFNQLAAMTIVCQAILNLDATVWKR